MANVKISQLPAAGTLQATDAFPLVQGSATNKGTIAGLDSRNQTAGDARYLRIGAGQAPGSELYFAQYTAGAISSTSTTSAGAVAIFAGAPTVFDGGAVLIEFFCPRIYNASVALTYVEVWDGATASGVMGDFFSASANASSGVHWLRRLTPSAGSHTFSLRLWVTAGTGNAYGGTGAAGAYSPMWFRITKV